MVEEGESEASSSSGSEADVLPVADPTLATLCLSAPLAPPSFDLLQRVTKIRTTGDLGTVCALVPSCDPAAPGVFSHWLYRVAWDVEFPGSAPTADHLDDAEWLSSNCLRPEELPASDLQLLPQSRTRGVRLHLPAGVRK